MLSGVKVLEHAFVSRPTVHNFKGGIGRASAVVGCILPSDDACVLHRYTCAVAPRYKLGDVLQDNKQYRTSCDADFAWGFPSLAMKRGNAQC